MSFKQSEARERNNRIALVEWHRISINVSFQIALDSQSNHDERGLETSWHTVAVTCARVPVMSRQPIGESIKTIKAGARERDWGGACRATTDEVAQSIAGLRCSWIIRVLTGDGNKQPTTNRSGSHFGAVVCTVWNRDAGTHVSQCANACYHVRKHTGLTIRHDQQALSERRDQSATAGATRRSCRYASTPKSETEIR